MRKIIHTIHLGNKYLTDDEKLNIESWIYKNPDYQVIVWIDHFILDDWVEKNHENIRFIPEYVQLKFKNDEESLFNYFKIWLMNNQKGLFIDKSLRCENKIPDEFFRKDTLILTNLDFLYSENFDSEFYNDLMNIIEEEVFEGNPIDFKVLELLIELMVKDYEIELITPDYFASKPRVRTYDTLFISKEVRKCFISKLKGICIKILR